MKKPMAYEKALDKAKKLCSRREICRAELIERLVLWGTSEADRIKICDVLEEEKYIDDSRFAHLFAKDKFRFNKWGKIKIRMMLRQKRIPDEITDAALSELNEKEYMKMMKEETSKKWKSVKDTNINQQKAKVIRFAQSRGYENGIVFELINSFSNSAE